MNDKEQQQAYQDFMLGGKRSKTTAPSTPASNSSTPRSSSGKKKQGKNEMAVFRAFQGRLQEWNDADHQLEAVLAAIANLRDRIWWEQLQQEELECHKPWHRGGRFVSALTQEDVQLALAHDLLQHEKMLASSRTLISSLAQAMDAMGRRLDEWMTIMEGVEEDVLLERVHGVYIFLAEDLYRKQLLVKKVLESCHDGLVDKAANVGNEGNPRSIARQCSREWESKDVAMGEMTRQLLER